MNEQRGISHQMYSNYINQHFLGSEGGVNAFRAAATTWRGTPHEAALLSLCEQVKADRKDLGGLVRALGYSGHPLKAALTLAVRAAGRLNPVNLLRTRQAGMAQVELDVLTGMLRAKLSMWETLLLVATRDPRLDVQLLRDLQRRAESQIAQVHRVIEASWEERFFAG